MLLCSGGGDFPRIIVIDLFIFFRGDSQVDHDDAREITAAWT